MVENISYYERSLLYRIRDNVSEILSLIPSNYYNPYNIKEEIKSYLHDLYERKILYNFKIEDYIIEDYTINITIQPTLEDKFLSINFKIENNIFLKPNKNKRKLKIDLPDSLFML